MYFENSISHYPGGRRRPISAGLKAGQMRMNGMNIFSTPSVRIQNNYYSCGHVNLDNCGMFAGYYEPEPTLFEKIMGGFAIGGSLLSGIADIWGWGGGGSQSIAEGAGSTTNEEISTKEQKDLDELKEHFGYKCSEIAGKYIATKNGETIEADSIAELRDAIIKKTKTKTKTTQTPDAAGNPTGNDDAADPEEEPAEGVSSKDDFMKIFSEDYVKTNYDPKKGLKVGNEYFKTEGEAYTKYTKTENKPVKSEGANLENIFVVGDTMGIFDDGKNAQGKDIRDFANAKIESFDKDNNIAKIGGREYKVEIIDGYIYIIDKHPTGGDSNPQVYILEQADGEKFQAHQRSDADLAYVKGTGQAATTAPPPKPKDQR